VKLNTDILYDNLSSFITVRHIGPKIQELVLDRPQFYLKNTKPEQHSVYISGSSFLPYECTMSRDSLLICVGGPPPNSYIRKNRSVFLIDDEIDILSLSNLVNDIFKKYDSWEKKLNDILEYDADITDMVRFSAPFFNNRLIVHNNLQIIAMAEPHVASGEIINYDISGGHFVTLTITNDWFGDFIQEKDRKGSFYHTSSVGYKYCVNNIFIFGQYAGGVFIRETFQPFSPSDAACLEFLARYIEAAMEQYNKININYIVSIKRIIANLLGSYPISKEQTIKSLKIMGPDFLSKNDRRYICFTIRPELCKTVPAEYFCNRIEKMFETCASLVYEDNIVSCAWFDEKELILSDIETKLGIFLSEFKLKAGLSNTFIDFTKVRENYKQAICAFEMGILLDPNKNIFTFQDYVLPYMLMNSTGEFSVEQICPEGLIKLYNSRDSSGVDYWITLTTYLHNGSNAAQTAKDLYLHRNSLYRRLEYIYSAVNMDFNDSNQLFLLQFCIKVLELQDRISGG